MINYLKQYLDLSEEAEQLINERIVIKEYKKGEHLFVKDDGCDDYFFVNEGLVRVYKVDEKGKDITLWITPENDFTSTLHGMNPVKRRPNSCECLEDSVVTYFTHKDMLELVSDNHELALVAIFVLFHIANKAINMINELKQSGKVKLRDMLENHMELTQRIPNMHIASYLGITPETLSRIKSDILKG
ncbi:MAG: Crp/Fnr family transcriptional regulator [Mangrovibacterium sp.]